jgi:hypothetical protein
MRICFARAAKAITTLTLNINPRSLVFEFITGHKTTLRLYRTHVFHIKRSRNNEIENWMRLIRNRPILANLFMTLGDVVNHSLCSDHEISYARARSFGIFVLFGHSKLRTRLSNRDCVHMR